MLLFLSMIIPALAFSKPAAPALSADAALIAAPSAELTRSPEIRLQAEDISLEKFDTLDRSQSELDWIEFTDETAEMAETASGTEETTESEASTPQPAAVLDEPADTQPAEVQPQETAAPTPTPEPAPALPQPAAPGSAIQLLGWFDSVDALFARGDFAIVTDLSTGLQVLIARTGGTNHADCEALDSDQTAILLQIAGGSWNWDRRPIIVEIDGIRIAASMTVRPHAGRDDKPALTRVKNRSGGYGTGTNYDTIKGNGMDGHFDIHFYGSKTHVNNRKDAEHQAAIQVAYHAED